MLAAAVLQAMLTPEGETTAPSLSAASWSNGDADAPVARLAGRGVTFLFFISTILLFIRGFVLGVV